MSIHTPVIATGSVYQDYLDAARRNLDALNRLALSLRDAEAGRETQRIIDEFDSAAEDLLMLIAEASDARPAEWTLGVMVL